MEQSPTICSFSTANDIPRGPVVVGDRALVADGGATYDIAARCNTSDGTVLGMRLLANSDFYTPTSAGRDSETAGINLDSSGLQLSIGKIGNYYKGASLTVLGLNPLARDIQSAFHNGLNHLGADTNPNPPLWEKENPQALGASIDFGISAKPLKIGPAYAWGDAGANVGASTINGGKPYASASASLTAAVSLNGEAPKPLTPMGASGSYVPVEDEATYIYGKLKGSCSVNDFLGPLDSRGKTRSTCTVSAEAGLHWALGNGSSADLGVSMPIAGAEVAGLSENGTLGLTWSQSF